MNDSCHVLEIVFQHSHSDSEQGCTEEQLIRFKQEGWACWASGVNCVRLWMRSTKAESTLMAFHLSAAGGRLAKKPSRSNLACAGRAPLCQNI